MLPCDAPDHAPRCPDLLCDQVAYPVCGTVQTVATQPGLHVAGNLAQFFSFTVSQCHSQRSPGRGSRSYGGYGAWPLLGLALVMSLFASWANNIKKYVLQQPKAGSKIIKRSPTRPTLTKAARGSHLCSSMIRSGLMHSTRRQHNVGFGGGIHGVRVRHWGTGLLLCRPRRGLANVGKTRRACIRQACHGTESRHAAQDDGKLSMRQICRYGWQQQPRA